MATHCADCGVEIKEKDAANIRQPCMHCGSLKRAFYEQINETVECGSFQRTKCYSGGKSKKKGLRFETKDGDELSCVLGRYVERHMLVDHEFDRYKERIIDTKTGKILKDTEEPLSVHRGHGSAKKDYK